LKQKNMKTKRRIWWWLLAAAILSGVLPAATVFWLETPAGSRWLLGRIRAETGWDLRCGDIDLSLLHGVAAEEMVLTPPGGSRPMAGANRIRIAWSPLGFLSRPLRLKSLELDKPWYHASVKPASSPRGRGGSGKGKRKSPRPPVSLPRVRVDSLQVEGGSLSADFSLLDVSLRGEGLVLPALESGKLFLRVGKGSWRGRDCLSGLSAGLSFDGNTIGLANLSGKICGGTPSGSFRLRRDMTEGAGTIAVSGISPDLAAVLLDLPPVTGAEPLELQLFAGRGEAFSPWSIRVTGRGVYPPWVGGLDLTLSPSPDPGSWVVDVSLPEVAGGSLQAGGLYAGVNRGGTELLLEGEGLQLSRLFSLAGSFLPAGTNRPSGRAAPVFRFLAASAKSVRGRLGLKAVLTRPADAVGIRLEGTATLTAARFRDWQPPSELTVLLGLGGRTERFGFRRASFEFSFSERGMSFSKLELEAGTLVVRGEGEANWEGGLDCLLEFDLPPEVVSRLGRDLRRLLDSSPAGPARRVLSCRLYGEGGKLRTDLLERAARRALKELLSS